MRAAPTIVVTSMLLALAGASAAQENDPYLWLEEVQSPRALEWVGARNVESTQALTGLEQYRKLQPAIKGVLDAPGRIPGVEMQGKWLYNFWRDPQHPRGIWRRTTLTEYRKAQPRWDTVIDVDQLAAAEKENWVWGGVQCLEPAAQRCLVSLTRGGGDAHVVREFDVPARRFVAGGFALPEAKGSLGWIDIDHVFVDTDFGPGSMTESGYPRIVKEWRRGTPLANAKTVFEGQPGDTSASAWKDFAPGHEREFVIRRPTFFTNELYVREQGVLTKIDKPDDAEAYTVRDQLMIELRSDWKVGGKVYAQGSLLAIPYRDFRRGARRFDVLFTPTATSSLQSVVALRDAIVLVEMDNVLGKVEELMHRKGQWRRRSVATPSFGTVAVAAFDGQRSNQYFLTVGGFLQPTTLMLASAGSDRHTPLKAMPAYFDTTPYKVEQWSARADDGTAVPYFVVMRKDIRFDGSNPTLLYGYGGFELTMRPSYSGVLAKGWLEQGGVYVLSNIRGGGEFGPRWHNAALKEHRQVSYSDFIRVAEDLVARKVTTPRHLGIMGGSLGGMLVSVAMLQRPDLFNAVVSQVPLTDMRRYHKMLAGASWIDEYGDPDVPAQWEYIRKYSPYHNVDAGKRYPAILYTSSTRDDRVHPAHARKMVARMREQGHSVLYWENMDGGHGGAVNNDQQAQLLGMVYAFLSERLGAKQEPVQTAGH
jgi:prolyl oligopeptidase